MEDNARWPSMNFSFSLPFREGLIRKEREMTLKKLGGGRKGNNEE